MRQRYCDKCGSPIMNDEDYHELDFIIWRHRSDMIKLKLDFCETCGEWIYLQLKENEFFKELSRLKGKVEKND